jgi:hypothetical protein
MVTICYHVFTFYYDWTWPARRGPMPPGEPGISFLPGVNGDGAFCEAL